MTTLTAAPDAAPTPDVSREQHAPRLTFGRLVRSEWIKFTTLRSTWWSFGLVAVISVGLGLLMAASLPTEMSEGNGAAVMVIVFSTVLTQLLAVIIGTITVTGEYSTGMIRSTLTAAPGRIGALLAKSLVVATTMFISSLIVFALTALVTGPLLASGMIDLSDPETSVMPLLGAALFLAVVAVIGVGIGFVIRNGPGALAAGIGIVFVAPVLTLFFPRAEAFEWVHSLASYLPTNAGQSLYMGVPMSGNPLDTWAALLTLGAWVVATGVAGAAVLKVRDA